MKAFFYHTIKHLFLCSCLFCSITALYGQSGEERISQIARKLDVAEGRGLSINEPVTIALNGTLQDLGIFLAESTSLNISVDPSIQRNVSINFTEANTKDILLYICDIHQMDLRFIGDIIQLVSYNQPDAPPPVKQLKVRYNAASGLITMDLAEDNLEEVAKRISELTYQNIVLDPTIRKTPVNAFINQVPLEEAMEQLAKNNGLLLENTNNYFTLTKPVIVDGQNPNQAANQFSNSTDNYSNNLLQPQNIQGLQINKVGADQVNLIAVKVPVLDIIREVGLVLGADFFILPEQVSNTNNGSSRQGQAGSNNTIRQNSNGEEEGIEPITIKLDQATFQEVLAEVVKNSSFDYAEQNSRFIIGQRTAEEIRHTKVLQLQYRSALDISTYIPPDFLSGVNVEPIMEYNSIILSGSEKNVREIEDLIYDLDKLVPVVMIEVIIIDIQTNKLDELGIEAGIAPEGAPLAGGSVISGSDAQGGFDFTFSSKAINDLLSMLDANGIVNLGRVAPNFFLSLKALQQRGIVEVKSTPKLSTLNSHLANLSIGQTRYYQEQQVNFPGSEQPIPVQSTVFKSVEANLDIKVTPIVSGDEQVTLDIEFEQSEFLAQTIANAPPPSVSRSFTSLVRAKNGEMLVLGGLERDSKSTTKRGIPWLSNIPILGWLFGRKTKNKEKDKLLIFVKPTIIN